MFEMTWEIETIMNFYVDNILKNRSIKNIMERITKDDYIGEVCSQAIELTCRENCGLIMPIDMAIEWVDGGSIVDYDGMGYALDGDGNRIKAICCDVDFLEECKKDGAVFMAWYNK